MEREQTTFSVGLSANGMPGMREMKVNPEDMLGRLLLDTTT